MDGSSQATEGKGNCLGVVIIALVFCKNEEFSV